VSAQSLAAEIGELARIATGFGERHNMPAAELLPYQRRKAETLTVIACEHGDEESREVASAAWRRIRELQARMESEDSCPGPLVGRTGVSAQ